MRRGYGLMAAVLVVLAWDSAWGQAGGMSETETEAAIERMVKRLAEIPGRWDALPEARIAHSGRSGKEVLDQASEEQKEQARELLETLLATPSEQRAAVIERVGTARALSEVDLWVSLYVVHETQHTNHGMAAFQIEVMLDLAEHVSRRDVLLAAAGFGLQLARLRLPIPRALTLAQPWAGLAPGPSGARNAAVVNNEYAQLLSVAGRTTEALAAYNHARNLFQAVGSKLGEANTWVGEAQVRYLAGENGAVLPAQQRARALYVAVGDKLGEAHTWNGEAEVRFLLGENEAALQARQRARALYVAVGNKLGEANTWNGEAEIQFRLGENEVALQARKRARALYVAVGNKHGEAATWLGEAEVWFFLEEKEAALQAQRRARSLYVAVGDKLGEANTWFIEARVRFRQGENEVALQAQQQARALYVAVGDKLGEANTWHGEADVRSQGGESEAALYSLQRARALYVVVGNKLGEAHTWNGEAEVRFLLGENEAALQAQRRARSLYVAVGDKSGEANTWQSEARVRLFMGENEAALQASQMARALYVAVGSKLGEANTWGDEADARFVLGENEAALQAQHQARALSVAVGSKLGEANTWLGEAEVRERLGQWDQAESSARKAVSLAMRTAVWESKIYTRLVLMRILAARDSEPAALAQAEHTLTLIKEWRNRGGSDLERTAMGDYSEPYDLLVPRLASKPRHQARALEHAEAGHAPVLLDLVSYSVRPRSKKTKRNPGAPEVNPLRDQIAALRKEQSHLGREIPRSSGTLRDKLETDRRRVDEDIEILELRLAAYTDSPLGDARPMTAKDMHKLVRQLGHPVLLYYVAQDETVAFLLQPGHRIPKIHILSQGRDELEKLVTDLRNDLATPRLHNPTREAERAKHLHDLLIHPFAAELAAYDRLTIIPHGPLHQLPFAALLSRPDSGTATRLFQRFHLSTAPSLSVLRELGRRAVKRKRQRQPHFVALATTDTLHHAAAEARRTAELFAEPARTLHIGAAATYQAYAQSAPRADYLLVSTHGVHVPQSRSGTHLELWPTEDHDYRLSAREIASIPIRATLVALSACDTATARAMLSDERLDLTRAFLIAGADTVLATRWKIPDSPATRQFVTDFFAAIETRSLAKDAALSYAQGQSLARGDDPQVWAAWVLVGRAR